MTNKWAKAHEFNFENTHDWTDVMWYRVRDEDATPQVRGHNLGCPNYVVDLYTGGATQINFDTNTRRTVRRVEVTMGFSTGRVRKDP